MSWFSVPRQCRLSIYQVFYEQSTISPIQALFLKFDRVGDQARDWSAIIEKIIDHDVRVLIFGMSREVAI